MTIARSAGDVLENHVTLELECLDRLYLNAYVPMLQTGGGAAWFFRDVRGNPVPSSALMAPMTRRFVTSLERFARVQMHRNPHLDLVVGVTGLALAVECRVSDLEMLCDLGRGVGAARKHLPSLQACLFRPKRTAG